MNKVDPSYQPLTTDMLAIRLGKIDALTTLLGTDTSTWTSKEVGDGNLNLVFIVQSDQGSVIVKQALPYVRLVGDSWPLPLRRSYFEYHALIRQDKRAPDTVPEVYYFDETQAIIVMEYFNSHVILRQSMMAGKTHSGLAETLGLYCARTLFRGSDLSMNTANRKADMALFANSVELCDITETLVFSDPYFNAERNHHTPQLDALVATLRSDVDLKVEAHHLKAKFCNNAETMLHGDLHTGSVMVSDTETKVIDPEFALYGPMGFDIGMLLANFWMAYFAQPGHAEAPGARVAYQEWILGVVDEIWTIFSTEFSRLWREERTGILYEKTLFEDQGHALASEQALSHRLNDIWQDTLGFAGVEIIRRTLSLAHIAENETIENDELRADCEARGLKLGRALVVNRTRMNSMASVHDLARVIAVEAKE
ncbi:S-methyl-5-thioribose kinase [Sedimentitalea sp. CY04]|uniref:S-methyl-5-thioribose kinase n=1 Tax=Parasedimentitalea denitrificans TaxID=2211118 RepID=A0ABX0W992_9RHOB|nr:S-methyl-5-thioribose kinase [Sedimentitalea sp. CY04]NIZ62215.1 S-methyl-5-thioribose kinase [Sedimentitalea sp. CY04]